VIGHLGLNVEDLVRAKGFYDELMAAVDFELYVADPDQVAYRPAAGKPGTHLFLYPATEAGPYSGERVGLQHLAFMVPTRSRVDDVHALALALGCEILDGPRAFPEYPPPYYATFFLDPTGIMLEAVCHHDRP
jgi:catechol 2,3-dioxygenase-like lactoylglutathione lyase family enzyme